MSPLSDTCSVPTVAGGAWYADAAGTTPHTESTAFATTVLYLLCTDDYTINGTASV